MTVRPANLADVESIAEASGGVMDAYLLTPEAAVLYLLHGRDGDLQSRRVMNAAARTLSACQSGATTHCAGCLCEVGDAPGALVVILAEGANDALGGVLCDDCAGSEVKAETALSAMVSAIGGRRLDVHDTVGHA